MALVCRLTVATVHCRTAVPLRYHKLKDGLLGRPDMGLAIQEAVLKEQLLLGLNIGSCSFLIENRQESFFEGFLGEPEGASPLGRARVILLFYLPIYDISGGQFRCPGGNSLLWIGLHAFWIRADSSSARSSRGVMALSQYSFDSRIGNLIQIILNLFLWEGFIQPTQKVGHGIIFPF